MSIQIPEPLKSCALLLIKLKVFNFEIYIADRKAITCICKIFSAGTRIYCHKIPAGTGVPMLVYQGPYP